MGGLRIRMLILDTETALYTEDRGLQVPMVLEYDYIQNSLTEPGGRLPVVEL